MGVHSGMPGLEKQDISMWIAEAVPRGSLDDVGGSDACVVMD